MKMITLLIFGLVSLFLVSNVFAETITKDSRGIKVSNANYTLDWELEDLGTAPHSPNVARLIGSVTPKNSATFDIAIVSPVKLTTGKLMVSYEKNQTVVTPFSYQCNSLDYGWVQFGKLAYCNISVSNPNGTSEKKTVIEIQQPYFIQTGGNSATIYWNDTRIVKSYVYKDMTSKKKYYNYSTIYGNNVYVIPNLTVQAGVKYDFQIDAKVKEEDLPFKYTIIIGKMETQQFYLIYDPTITNSRTWTVERDFKNNTVLSNITPDTDISIRLNDFDYAPTASTTCGVYLNLSDNAATQPNPCTLGDTITNLADYTANGVYNGAYDFERTNVDYMAIDDPGAGNNLDATTALTIGFWMRAESLDLLTQYFMVDKGVYTVKIRTDTGSGCTIGNRCICFVKGGISTTCSNTALGVVDSWQKVDVVYDGAAGGSVYFYLNGTLAEKVSLTGSLTTDNVDLFIGSNPAHTDTVEFDGILEDVYLLKANSSAAQIAARYLSGRRYRKNAVYSDTWGWTPQSGNAIKNVSVALTTSGTQAVQFRYNRTNSSVGTSSWQTISTNGTNTILTPGLGANDAIYYQFKMNDTNQFVTPRITSYTINEGTTIIVTNIESPTTAIPLSVVANKNITVRFNMTLDGTPQSSGVKFKNATTENQYWMPHRRNLECSGTAQVCSLYAPTSACTDAGCSTSTDSTIIPVGTPKKGFIASGTGSTEVTLPEGVTTNDIIIIALASDNRLDSDGITAGQGYVNIQQKHSGAVPGSELAYHRMNSTENNTVNILQEASVRTAYVIQAWRGINTTVAIDGQHTNSSLGSGDPDSPAMTPVTTGAQVFTVGLIDDDDSFVNTVPSGYNNATSNNTQQASTTVGSTVVIASRRWTGGSPDPAAWVISGTDAWISWTFALKPQKALCSGTPTACDARLTSATCAQSTNCLWSRTGSSLRVSGTDWFINLTTNSTSLSGLRDMKLIGNYTNTLDDDTETDCLDYGGAADSCTYPGSGDWTITCSDNCIISSPVDLLNNKLVMTGAGSIYFNSNIDNCGEVTAKNSCDATVKSNVEFCRY